MLRVAALLICAIIVALPPSGTALAQKAAPKLPQPPSDPGSLVAWCNAAVFIKYGKRNTEYGPKTFVMPLEQQAMMQDSCIRSKGRTY